MRPLQAITEGLQFPEGPIAMPDGSIILVEIARGTLTRVHKTGKKEVIADLGGGPNGAAIGPDGACYVCNNGGFKWEKDASSGYLRPIGQSDDYVTGRIERVDLETGKVERLYDTCGENRLNGPNDLVFDKSGNIWFTDLGKARDRDRTWIEERYTGHVPMEVKYVKSYSRLPRQMVLVCPLMKRHSMWPKQREHGSTVFKLLAKGQ